MKKYGIGSRVLTLLLVLALVVSMVPSVGIAANVGDIGTTGDALGSTGLTGNVDTQKTISWPVKIYDYLNDGMLFEYANAGDIGDIPDALGGAYGGGTPAPQMNGAAMVLGNDYTIGSTFDENAFKYLGTSGTNSIYSTNFDTSAEGAFELAYTEVEAKNFVDPGYLNLEYVLDQNGDKTRSYIWISNFARDNTDTTHPYGQYYSGEQVRYAVIVYRTNDAYTAYSGRFYWAVSDGYFGDASDANSDYYYHTVTKGRGGINITDLSTTTGYGTLNTGYEFNMPKSTDWTYVVVDMKQGAVATYWNNFDTEARVAGIGIGFPLNAIGEEMDISHIAYFDTEFEATQFGIDAVAFDKDPGEYLNAHTEYVGAGETVPVSKPAASGNVFDFTIASGTYGTSASGYSYESGFDQEGYATWTTAQSGRSYIGGVTVEASGSGTRRYVNVSNSTGKDKGVYAWYYDGGGSKSALRYATVVYRTNGFTANDNISFWVQNTNTGAAASLDTSAINGTWVYRQTFKRSEGEWTYLTFDLDQIANADGDYNSISTVTRIGMYLPDALSTTKTMDIAFIDFYSTSSAATSFGSQAAAFMNGETTISTGTSYPTTEKTWNTGNNVAFSFLWANTGGGWSTDGDNGGYNTNANGYYSYQIGETVTSNTSNTQNDLRDTAEKLGYPVADSIFLINQWQSGLLGSGVSWTDGVSTYDTKDLDFGYTLLNTLSGGLYTAGLLESSLTTVTGTDGVTYRVPDYKEETVEYIAYLLRDSLIIPQTDASGNYNYNFVKGTANGEQYGYDGDKAMDLASALRKELGITFASDKDMGTYTASVGDYSKMTDADKAGLIGEFSKVKSNIDTFVDAAYYLLMNLYVGDSYNQAQDTYNYLVLSEGTISETGKTAYVFDGGFTTGIVSNTANTSEYRASSQSAVKYNKELKTISLTSGLSKDQVYFTGSAVTTRFPFLPVTDSTGVYAGETKSPYFLDDGRGPMGVTEEGATFVNRNYNFALASNGEFIYHYDDGLFFEFEGDDDVYLFVNGELVLDIGAAHSITSVKLDLNDYVDWARQVLANPSSYSAADVARAEKLNLVDGEAYAFDFYYMERHGWGSNCRIATNIPVTDPALDTNKQAYQGTDVNGDPIEVDYGGIVDVSKPVGYSFAVTNKGDTKLYKLSFEDANIGLNLSYDNGLQVYSEPAVKTFTAAAGTKVTITGLNGVVSLDGVSASVQEGGTTIEVKTDGSHELKLYQFASAASDDYSSTELMKSVTASVQVGTAAAEKITVDGIRVTDSNGGVLDVSDLIITVDGYSSKANYDAGVAMDTFYINGKAAGEWETVTGDDGNVYKRLTFYNANEWTKVYAYYWSEDGRTSNSWPGAEMQTAADNSLYVDVPEGADYVIFNNNAEDETDKQQTQNLKLAGEDSGYICEPLTNADLMNFLSILQDPNSQTKGDYLLDENGNIVLDENGDPKLVSDDVAAAALYQYSGLWQYATVKISGFYYTLTAAEQAANKFTNTVYTTGYQHKNGVAPIKSQDRHIVYGLGDFEYYQWAAHTVHVDNATLWADVYAARNSSTDSLSEEKDQIDNLQKIVAASGTSVLTVQVTDKNGNAVTDTYNMYGNGTWGTYEGDGKLNGIKVTVDSADDSGLSAVYLKTENVPEVSWGSGTPHVYFWSNENTSMTTWPGDPMTQLDDGTWYYAVPVDTEYVVFNNGSGGYDNQTDDIALPETSFTAVHWNSTNKALEVTFNTSGRHIFYVKISAAGTTDYVIVPVVFYVADVEDCYYVLDYGVSSDTITFTEMFAEDDFLANYGMASAQFLGFLTDDNNPEYLDKYSTDGLSNFNRVAFDGSLNTTSNAQITVGDGAYSVGKATQCVINYTNGKYSVSDDYALSYKPNKYMDDEYDLWMAMVVYDNYNEETKAAQTFSALGAENTSSTTSKKTIDIHKEAQMLKKITVLPATVVYYEDDFDNSIYTTTPTGDTSSKFAHYGNGSGNLIQGIEAETPYGQDEIYQDDSNAQISGNSMTKIKVTDTKPVATFSFKGTGFELIARTNAFDSASMVVKVFADKDANGVADDPTKPDMMLPVITEFTNEGAATCEHEEYNSETISIFSGTVSADATHVVINANDGNSGPQTGDLVLSEMNDWAADSRSGGSYKITKNTDGTWLVKFDNTNTNWSFANVYAYANNQAVGAGWPGTAMTTGEEEIKTTCKNCGATYTEPVEEETPDYYLIGYLDGTEYSGTDYKFDENGNLVVRFSVDSYVAVMDSNGSQYYAKVYLGDTATSAYLHSGCDEKLRIPGGVWVTFNLTQDSYGNMILTYDSQTEPDYVTTEAQTIYFDKSGMDLSENWENVYVYYWSNANSSMTSWTANPMTQVAEGSSVYSYQIPAGVQYVIFHNGSSQTGNLKMADGLNAYNGYWGTYESGTVTLPTAPTVSGSTATDSATRIDEVDQVPVIRVDGLDLGNYVVEISGMPTYDFSKVTYTNGVADYSTAMVDTYIYLDGIRIYQPLGETNGHYSDTEDLAVFYELRDMILNGQAAVAAYNSTTTQTYTGNISWTENRNGELGGYLDENEKTTYVGNQISNIDDYMIVGPNNEVYMNGNAQNQAVIFYVAEAAYTYHSVQVAARCIDPGLFAGTGALGVDAALYMGVADGYGYAWKQIDLIESGTEQYYTIDYTSCPTITIDGVNYYQVALMVTSGMVSFTNVKLVGMDLVTNPYSDATTLTYGSTGTLYEMSISTTTPDSGSEEGTTDGSNTKENAWNFYTISQQVRSNVYLRDAEPEIPNDVVIPDSGSDNTGSENTGSDNIGSEDTGSDNTGSENTGSDNTGSDNTGSDNTGSEDTGSENTGSENTGSENTGSENTGSENTGSENTGSENTGSENTGSENTGSENTGSENTGSENTGSENTGSESTGSENTDAEDSDPNESIPKTGDIAMVGLVIVALVCVAFVASRKKLF